MARALDIPIINGSIVSPTIALRRDLEIVEWVERLGFAEACHDEALACRREKASRRAVSWAARSLRAQRPIVAGQPRREPPVGLPV